jgi:hypothetical protein
MTPAQVGLAVWIASGAVGALIEGTLVLRSSHVLMVPIRERLRSQPGLVLPLILFCVLLGPIELGMVLGTYRKE